MFPPIPIDSAKFGSKPLPDISSPVLSPGSCTNKAQEEDELNDKGQEAPPRHTHIQLVADGGSMLQTTILGLYINQCM